MPDAWLFRARPLFVVVTLFMPARHRRDAHGEVRQPPGGGEAPAGARDRPEARGRGTRLRERHRRDRPAPPPARPTRPNDGGAVSTSMTCASPSTATSPARPVADAAAGEMRRSSPERRRQDHEDGLHHRQDQARQRHRPVSTARDDPPLPWTSRPTPTLGIGRKFQKPTVISRATRWPTTSSWRRGAARGGRLPVRLAQTAWRASASTRSYHVSASSPTAPARRPTSATGRAMAGDRDAAGAGPEAPPRDEPVAGMTDAETAQTAELLRRIAGDHAVVVVEHDMHFVRALQCRVTCLHEVRGAGRGLHRRGLGPTRRWSKCIWGGDHAERRGHRPVLRRGAGPARRLA